jgi:SAM-dependent methyltransferase
MAGPQIAGYRVHPEVPVGDPASGDPSLAPHSDWGSRWLDGRRRSTWGRRHQYKPSDWNAHWRENHRFRFDQSGRVTWILDRLPCCSPLKILDVACGSGLIALPLARAGHAVTGIDVSTVGIDRLRADARAEGLENLRAIAADWRAIGLSRVGTDFDLAIVCYGLGTVDACAFMERMFAVAATVVVVEPAGPRHWQHPEFWPLYDGEPFDPGPDHRFIERILLHMGYAPRTEVGTYETHIAFSNLDEAVGWLLDVTRVDPGDGERTARKYLNQRLHPESGKSVLRQTQSIAMLTMAN